MTSVIRTRCLQAAGLRLGIAAPECMTSEDPTVNNPGNELFCLLRTVCVRAVAPSYYFSFLIE
jgi:hypothetical protein